jgi:hypothetical protein
MSLLVLAQTSPVRLLSWVLPVVLACGHVAQSQARAPDASQARHIVSGTVVNSATGAPIPRALVKLNTQSSRYVMSEADGTFRFEGVPEGLVVLEAEKPTFFKPGETSSEVLSLPAFQLHDDVRGIVLRLVPQARLSGHVLSALGAPIEHFPIRLYLKNIVDGAVQWENVATVNTDHEGYFVIFDMPEESVIVSAGPEQWRSRPAGAKHLGYPLTFYPNAREFSGAGVLSVLPGQELEADFSLRQEPLFELSGVVLGVPPALDAKVEVSTVAGDPVPLSQPHPEQHEFFGYVTPGRYVLRASSETNGQTLHATMPLTIESDTPRIQVTLAPQPSIQVNVHTESRDRSHDRYDAPLTADVELISTTTLIRPVRLEAQQVRGQDETVMEIPGVEPGTYSLVITPSSGYVNAATSGSTDLLLNDLLVPEAGRVAPIDILLASDGGQLEGDVKMSEHTKATVVLVPAGGATKNLRTAEVTPIGHFMFDQVCPGNYLALAFDRVDRLEYRNPDVLSQYLPNAVRVTVAPHQQVTTALDLIRLER